MPSENVGDILELWQCCGESYERIIKHGEVIVPDKVVMFKVNALHIIRPSQYGDNLHIENG